MTKIDNFNSMFVFLKDKEKSENYNLLIVSLFPVLLLLLIQSAVTYISQSTISCSNSFFQ